MSKWLKDVRDKKVVSFDALDKAIHVDNAGAEVTPLPEPPNWRQTDSVMVVAPGYWWLHSKVDRRWIAEGKSDEVGGITMCREAKIKFWDMKKRFGKVPWDFIYRFEPRDLRKFKLASDNIKID